MSKLTERQIATAKGLLKKYPSEKQVFVKVENGHMYFKKESALISVGGDEKKLEEVTRVDEEAEQRKAVAAQEKADKEKEAAEKAARDKAARDTAAREKAEKEKAARDKAAKEKAEKEKAAKDAADKSASEQK